MVSVSVETAEQTEQRLRSVILEAELVVLDGSWYFAESPACHGPPPLTGDELAVVRDEDSWCRLVPLPRGEAEVEQFGVFAFHFPAGVDNSGFVGWLAGLLKARLGTGVFVVCGSNRARGGIYDYWGCPIEMFEPVIRLVETMR